MPTNKKTRGQLSGFVAECLVLAYAILGAKGKLDGFRPSTDIDHKDLILDVVGGFFNAYIQVKCATSLHEGVRVMCTARYPADAIPSDPRFAYVFCLLDPIGMELTRIWLVPSEDFNRLAYRGKSIRGKVTLSFACRFTGDPKWDKYLVDKRTLGPRLLKLTKTSTKPQPINDLDLSSVLVVRGSATTSR